MKGCPFRLGNEYSEYFIGLLLTDGCITRHGTSKSIVLSLKDKEMVERFRDFYCPKNKVSTVLQKKYGTYIYQTGANSAETASWLQKCGNFINKSYECDIYVPITPHILRGIFDGDGSWHHTNHGNTIQWSVCGRSKVFIEKIQKYLISQGINAYFRKSLRPGNRLLYYVEIQKTIDMLRVASLMYKEAHIYLQRKYDTGHLFVETLKEKCAKFRESEASANPEPSYNSVGKLIDRKTGRYIIEGAETIMRYLSTEQCIW